MNPPAKNTKLAYLFILITCTIMGGIGYLGYRILIQEAAFQEYQTQRVAKSHVHQLQNFIMELLEQKQISLTTHIAHVKLENAPLRALIANNSDIDAVFVLANQKIIFPDQTMPLSVKDQNFITAISPIIQDPKILQTQQGKSELESPKSGWFFSRDHDSTTLIYWTKRDNNIIGIKLSYTKFMSDVIAKLRPDIKPDGMVIHDNGQRLYEYYMNSLMENATQSPPAVSPTYSQNLLFPLHNWKIDYYTPDLSHSFLLLSIGMVIVIILVVGLVMVYLYRELTRTARLARQQVNFVGQVSHELKTPLTNIALYAELLQEQEEAELQPVSAELDREYDEYSADYHKRIQYLDIIISESKRLSRLIQNVLSFTKSPKLNLQQFDINEILNNIYEIFLTTFTTKGILLNLQTTKPLNIVSDKDCIIQIMSNLLSNAEKYASDGKQVDLILEQTNDMLLIHVRDYGQGIAVKDLKAIFQPFYRIHNNITEGIAGTGIGLTIAQQLAHSLNGWIEVENKTVGVQFTLKLPLI